ncbi:hypothetical protein, partial [Listeria monocytogenes]|uniref:hypothetical protein n=1 Tax=Listeria monocytogenes TaxID=1639 RepID=UPI0019696DDD
MYFVRKATNGAYTAVSFERTVKKEEDTDLTNAAPSKSKEAKSITSVATTKNDYSKSKRSLIHICRCRRIG